MTGGRRPAAGFTFLEMLLVVAILSGVAMLAMATASDVDGQHRFEDTQQRLTAIRRAVLGVADPAYDGQVRLSGFVADNGVLPGNLSNLTLQGTFATHDAKQAVFDAAPDGALSSSPCLSNDLPPVTLAGDANKLFKGWRGRYLPATPGATAFRDGWGNVSLSDDTTNFGWSVSTASGFAITSYGRDNASSGSGYDADATEAMASSHWQVDLNGWQVQVKNNHSTSTMPSANNLRVSVLAFVNDSSGGKWKRVTSASIATGSIPANGSVFVAFSDKCDNSAAGDSLVPQGRHLVVLVTDSNSTAHDGETMADADSVTSGDQYATRQAAFFAGADRPAVTLEIK